MQHNKYRGRLTVILVVLALALLGIFPPERLWNSQIPWGKKHNLKPGIDISGGTSLLYEIKAPPGEVSQDLSQRVADSLKKRVDPEGVRNLVWRPQGPTRLEIQMPMSQGSGAASAARKAFAEAQANLERTNIRAPEVSAALAIKDEKTREVALGDLAMGSPARKALFDQLAAVARDLAAAEKANDPIKKVDARDEMDRLERKIEETNLPIPRLQAELELAEAAIDKATKEKSSSVAEEKRKEMEAKVNEFKKQADFQARKDAIEDFAHRFVEFAKVKGSVDDAEDLKRLLRGSGVLEFHIAVTDGQVVETMAQRLRTEGPLVKPGDTMRWYEVDRPDQVRGHQTVVYGDKTWILLSTTADASMVHAEGSRPWGLRQAYKDFDGRTNQAVVGFEFDAQGAASFGELTGSHINQPLAIVLDDKVISAPNINSRIENKGTISGSYTDQELRYLISTLNAGSLPARLTEEPISERVISPTLGADNLKAGFVSCMIGLVVVTIFLLSYYYLAGAVAMVAVTMNMVIIVGVLAMFDATFTLPGIAAMVLTLGSAVDANVLIFERLREEEQRGLTLRMALRNAYDRAWSAILDSNVITIITSMILYWFGSEEVKGFGLTLLIGIASSLFTALFVTRTIFDMLLERTNIQRFGSLPLTFPAWERLLRPNIDWMGKIGFFIAGSALILIVGLAAFFTEGRKMYDIEFVSGTSVQFELKEPATRAEVVEWLTARAEYEKTIPAVQVVAVGSAAKEKEYEVVTPNDSSAEVRDTLMKALQGRLNIDEPSKFEHVDDLFDQAYVNGPIRPIADQLDSSFPWAQSALQLNRGGVAVVLDRLNPPLTTREIAARIERARLQPDRINMPYRKITVLAPTDPAKPATTALVIVSDENYPYDKDEGKWQQELARPIWKLVTEAINKPASLQKVSNFNPQVARGTLFDAISALTISVFLVMIYIWLRFGNFRFGSATVVAMLHDVLIVIGAIGLSHYLSATWFGRHVLLLEPFRMNLTLVAAVLTVMGYSMMDTIVVFDRIRENRGKFGYVSRQVINDSINQTLSRTLLTAGTTIVTVFVMYVFGGPGLHGFTFALLVGILVGTYSSIAIAAPILIVGSKVPAAMESRKSPVGQLQRV